ncbi:sulfurtransferase TusA family protein [Rhizobium sp. CG4]|jgi:tRNA 2-thiouridine synthesizing protein A|uniref:sulfurtransferase TusA family protein n=1 Tax=Rhizobium/Agrobacterium group TaxID=227290 RepID=UPI00177DD842|nr:MULTISPECIES: sulfurtransferase TusA family protein [Rhizobium/Agrobacterium group]MBD9390564.1 sulfurtransferase TusA family protein [Agrobacterium sp. AGB01]MCM2458396.1 sulfurtransferase TusA family protein [Rhizobium sp. CG4]MCS4245300.1 tRNA 2-thiouridine synthesizing protein A [Rhizobium sp. BIGb0125]
MTSSGPEMLDLRGLRCPLPVLRARKLLAKKQSGFEFIIETTDPLAVIDIPHLCNEDGHALLESTALENSHRFHIRKG